IDLGPEGGSGGGEIIATGLRNSVGFDWAPWNGALYATDNGRDMLGDDFPPCELNRIEQGNFYGWPYFNGANVPDPDMGPDPEAAVRQPVPPVHGFRAHNAPLGIRFLDGSRLPQAYRRSALVALHGSWNRSEPDGYKVVSLHWDDTGAVEERDFLWGLNVNGKIHGRPVDVAQGPDGAIYISDDYAGAVYRIARGEGTDAALAGVAATRFDPEPPGWLASADLPALAATGKALYDRHACAACHEQGANAKSLANLNQRLGYAAVIDALAAPQSPMPVYAFTPEQQRALAVFLLAPEQAR
ncbi:MAG: PQQ-dependent sugar dehydrogenase, partial [Halioglobus sp.]|nr:PQQ-dependent sugar dehydrogenase [Halioglobus sp.]